MLVALTPNDELNILSCMTAKKLGTLDVSVSCGKIQIPFLSPEFKLRKGVLIAAIIRGKEIIIPNGNSSIQPGDTVVVVTDVNNVLNELDDIFIIS